MDPKSFELRNAVSDWEEGEKRYNRYFRISPEHVKVQQILLLFYFLCSCLLGFLFPTHSTHLQTETIVVHDAVRIFAAAIREMHSEDEVIPTQMSCKQISEWRHGPRIVEYMKMVIFVAITGVEEGVCFCCLLLVLNIVVNLVCLFTENGARNYWANYFRWGRSTDALPLGDNRVIKGGFQEDWHVGPDIRC